MRKSLMTLTVAATVSIGSLFGGYSLKTEAASGSLKEQQRQIENKQSDVAKGINEKNEEISRLQNQQDDAEKQIEKLGLAIADTSDKITEKTNKIAETKAQIVKLNGEIAILQDRIKKRNELLKDRARNYQENGGVVNYLDVLMGSQNFSDFVDRANAVASLIEADRGIVEQHERDKAEVEKKTDQVKSDLASLQKMVSGLQTLKQKLNGQVDEQNRLVASLEKQQHEAENEKLGMEEESSILAAQKVAVQQAIQLEQQKAAQRAAAEAAAKKAAEEAARKAAEAAAAARSHHSSSNSASSSESSDPAPAAPVASAPVASAPISSGAFTKPTIGVLTSGFGGRWGRMHFGIDFGNSAPNVPVFAAADGVVIKSYLSSSYGNCILISHYIDGQQYTTLYAHLQARLVNGGSVSKGQQIGIMGNTGDSTGKHLHFELHRGEWNAAKSNAINPVGIVPI
ncbi:murein hydrolase activator EnvC family protein [Neobacillus terrae]|uniref:murein hydrolase activator EnvC family protein n=1 Tax=Neobacillus terrae TaxID=3034837 RepID=UPI0014092E37|nr:M23 family metallopeptidase [Neobacillus terrae]NHM29934.1 peptidoglycan DD-metalloendopeptidase family protein [Neobacillus terrae]